MEHKMNREDRAKQFAPFAALKGFEEALIRAGTTPEDRREFSEEYLEEMDEALRALHTGDRLRIICYREGAYEKMTGCLRRIDEEQRVIQIGEERILFSDVAAVIPEDEGNRGEKGPEL